LEGLLSTGDGSLCCSTGAWKDRLDSINGCAISYDTIGNPEVYRNGTVDSWDDPVTYYMDWENGRQLTYLEVWGDWQQRITYDYDADGIRTYKNVEGITHSYVTQNGKVVRETIGSGTTAKVLDFIYDESGKPFALKYTNGTAEPVIYYYVLNLQGDVVKLITESGTEAASYTYTAWGEILTSSGTMASINPLRYRGYYYDTETGFYYLQSRYYDPVLHRFINADAAEYSAMSAYDLNGTNLFAYCLNDPTNRTDEAGNWSWKSVLKVVAAAAVVVAVTAVCVATAGTAAVALGASSTVVTAVATGTTVGGLVAGGSEIASQIAEKGADNINLLDVGAKTLIGSGYGASRALAITGNPLGRLGVIATNSINTLYDGIRDKKPFSDVVLDTLKTASVSAVFQFCGAAKGAQPYNDKASLQTAFIAAGKAIWHYVKNYFNEK